MWMRPRIGHELDLHDSLVLFDSVCIDQSSIAERNHQVALMADIYRKCKRCLIWLGQTGLEADYLDSLSELLGALSEKHQPDAPHINPMLGRPHIPLMFVNEVAWRKSGRVEAWTGISPLAEQLGAWHTDHRLIPATITALPLSRAPRTIRFP